MFFLRVFLTVRFFNDYVLTLTKKYCNMKQREVMAQKT